MEASEKELIHLCISGNHLAQKKLYDQYAKKLYGICLRYASNEFEAQDILQDGFVKIFTRMYTFKFAGSFEGWLKKIIIHTAIESYRKRVDLIPMDDIHAQGSVSIQDEKTLETEELLKLIQELPPGYRIIFNMYAIEGYSHNEIARELGISEGTSKSQLARARAYLQKKLIKINRPRINPIQPILILLRLIT